MTTRDRVSLEFTGLDEGVGELTWGQRFVWNILQSLAPANHYLNIRFRVHLPSDVTRERVLAALHTLVRRHDVLRTRFPVGPDGEPEQHCDASGDLPVEICRTDPGRVRRLAEQDEERLWREPFRHEAEWPLRVSVIVAGGRPRQVVFVFSHLAADAWGCSVLRREFLDLLRSDRAAPALAGWRPLARAEFELSPPGRDANDRSLAYWRRVLETTPQTAFPTLQEAGESPRFPGLGLHSVALAAAAQAVAARHRVGPAAVLLAALSTIIGIRTGTDIVPLFLAAGNRFTPVDAASVGTFYQGAPVLTRLDTGSLAGTIRNAHQVSTLAYLRGQSDPRDVARLLDTVNHRRGLDIDLSSTVNVVPEPGAAGPPPTIRDVAELRELTASTRVSDLEGRDSERLKLYLHVKSLRSRAVIELFCDSRYLTAPAARQALAGLELVLIELLEAGDLSIDRVADLVGIAPLARPRSCVAVDNCWIDVDAVRGLLGDLPETVAAQAFVVGPDDGPARLVAYVVAAQPTTPERLHAALLRRLDGHLSMTPQWYVVCRTAPARPESRAEWERQPVLLQGSGRAGGQLADTDSTPSIDAHRGA
ncbi:condensation domain-containing protein [Dactylosporangium sp. NPDC005572]|uniref:condensation domain-containing protein n=1 Tax=Dactylosporangium sp. NPDC005572 TaxID=3156889 RepID=UPI0033AF3ADE